MPETENKCRNYHNEWINRYLRELIKNGNLPKEYRENTVFIFPFACFTFPNMDSCHHPWGGHSEIY
ncbi:hypothetical protein HMPREF0101_00343 [Bacteroides fragilis]|nr:hypothetical protein HMPREF0101_00343 [Bacteroides fragilis]